MSMPTSNHSSVPSWSNPRDMKEMGEEIHDVAALKQQDQEDYSDDFLSRPFSTLDEPVKDTIMRDLTSVWTKLKVVLMPLKRTVSFMDCFSS